MPEYDRYDVAAISLMIRRGPFGDDHVDGPGGSRLKVGSRWPAEATERGMTVHVEADASRLSVCLAMRFDDFEDIDWEAFAALPVVTGFLGTGPVGWFLLDASGLHMRGAFPIGRDAKLAASVQRIVRDPDALRTLTLFGIHGETIRSVHVGIGLERLWTLFGEATQDVAGTPTTRDYINVIERFTGVPAGIMFSQAMRRHLEPRPDPDR